MAYTTIDDPSAYFHTQLYTGTGSTNAITNDANAGDFSPDWLWIKNRTTGGGTGPQIVFDTTRGNTKDLHTHNTEAEHTNSHVLLSFDTDGFSVGTSGAVNNNTDNFVAWQWKANGGTTSSNTDGSITSTVQANTTAGFSIVTYTGTGSGATIGHGVGKELDFIIIKRRSDSSAWAVYSRELGSGKKLELNGTSGTITNAQFFTANPTSSVFSLGTEYDVNGSGGTFVAYCFASIQGYSKIGKYTGNGSSTNGSFIYTGFRPAFILWKQVNTAGSNWGLRDNKRGTFNPTNDKLLADTSAAETEDWNLDLLSNGFKWYDGGGATNLSGSEYIYYAVAEHPFVSSDGTPATAF